MSARASAASVAHHAAFALGLSSVCAVGGCYWSSQPSTPHRNVAVDLASMPELPLPRPRALQGSRIIVLGLFDSTAPQPIGGLYDKSEYEISPLYRTYFFKDGAVEVFEHVTDGLRASGLVVLKDYAGHAEPSMLEGPLRARAPMLATATVTTLQHDQIREKGENQDWEVGRLGIDLRVRDSAGVTRLAKSYLVEGRVHFDGHTEMLRLLGWRLAETLTADPQFVAAVAARAGG